MTDNQDYRKYTCVFSLLNGVSFQTMSPSETRDFLVKSCDVTKIVGFDNLVDDQDEYTGGLGAFVMIETRLGEKILVFRSD